MDKCFLHRNGCARKWELYQGERKPVCGQGGFVLDDECNTRQWDNADDAITWARNNLNYATMEVVGI